MSGDDPRWMGLALALGRRGQGRTWPNPSVGCVIVRGGRVLGRGWTQDGGRPHAEAVALSQAGDAAGATAYVTLEPCAHQGRGPACAGALARAGVARVVVATDDPDPRTSGQGLALLRAAGIAVEEGVREGEARADLAGYLLRLAEGRPLVTLKLAASLDGRIATASGESRWITGAPARAWVHALRASHDAVLVGAGTVRADDPRLSARGLGERPQPVRVVLTSDLDIPREGQLARTAREVPLWLVHGPEGAARVADWEALGAVCLGLPGGPRDLAGALAALGRAGLTRVLCEGGGEVAAGLLGAGLVDRLALVQAGVALGAEGRPALGRLGLARLDAAPRLRLAEVRRVGEDVVSIWERP